MWLGLPHSMAASESLDFLHGGLGLYRAKWKLSVLLKPSPGSGVALLLSYSIGQASYYFQFRFKERGNRPHLSMGGYTKDLWPFLFYHCDIWEKSEWCKSWGYKREWHVQMLWGGNRFFEKRKKEEANVVKCNKQILFIFHLLFSFSKDLMRTYMCQAWSKRPRTRLLIRYNPCVMDWIVSPQKVCWSPNLSIYDCNLVWKYSLGKKKKKKTLLIKLTRTHTWVGSGPIWVGPL